MIIYKILRINGEELNIHQFEDDEIIAVIPFHSGNRHYQEYLEWLDKGNTPEYIDITE